MNYEGRGMNVKGGGWLLIDGERPFLPAVCGRKQPSFYGWWWGETAVQPAIRNRQSEIVGGETAVQSAFRNPQSSMEKRPFFVAGGGGNGRIFVADGGEKRPFNPQSNRQWGNGRFT